MRKTMIGTIVVAAASLVAASAFAGEGKGGKGGHFDRLDANGDGEISADEMNDKTAAFLEGADADGNGAVSKEEMKAFHKAKREERRAKHSPDKNGDGIVDRTEYISQAQERFDKMDKDGNGVLSEEEQHRSRGRHHRRGGDKE